MEKILKFETFSKVFRRNVKIKKKKKLESYLLKRKIQTAKFKKKNQTINVRKRFSNKFYN